MLKNTRQSVKDNKIDNFKKSGNFKKKSMDTFKIFDIKTKCLISIKTDV